ncbi:histidine phosphatase superfamily [Gautieria morchelliformis]|nr:histidine phosphatase superfamily [Gautieria morchelliformis]
MIEKIYIARHGFRLNWVTTTWESPTGTPRDPPLAAYGERQAKELADYFASLSAEDRPTAIFSSPFYRCLQTSAPVAAALDVPVYVDNGLSEWFRPVVPGTGLHPIPPPAETAALAFPSLHIDAAAWQPTWVPSRKGESVEELHNRCQGFLRAFIPRTEQLHGGRHMVILLVSHAATAIALTREFVGDRNLSMRAACCSLTTLTRPPARSAQAVGVWQSRGLATGDFLRGGLERSWGFEDVELDDHQVVEEPGVPGTESEAEENIGLQVLGLISRM